MVLLSATLLALPSLPPAPEQESTAFPLVFTDDLEREVKLFGPPMKVVTLAPTNTQIVYAIGAGEKIVGVSRFDEFPPELVERVRDGTVATVGGGYDPSIERIVALDPDIILANGQSQVSSKPMKRLQELGYEIVGMNPLDIEGVIENILLVGRMMDETERAKEIVQEMRKIIESVELKTAEAPKPKVYIENWHDPIFTVGPGSIQDEMISRAGGINIFSDLPKGSAQIGAEPVISRNPDIIISFNDQKIGLEVITNRPGWDIINAVKNNRVYLMDPQEGSPNPRIANSLLKMAELIHPELFK